VVIVILRIDGHYSLVRTAWLVSFLGTLVAFVTGGLAGMIIQFVLSKHGK
jgi:hypothetical protein